MCLHESFFKVIKLHLESNLFNCFDFCDSYVGILKTSSLTFLQNKLLHRLFPRRVVSARSLYFVKYNFWRRFSPDTNTVPFFWAQMKKVIDICMYIFLGIFTIEMIVKVRQVKIVNYKLLFTFNFADWLDCLITWCDTARLASSCILWRLWGAKTKLNTRKKYGKWEKERNRIFPFFFDMYYLNA